jgi:hypothetical protein
MNEIYKYFKSADFSAKIEDKLNFIKKEDYCT